MTVTSWEVSWHAACKHYGTSNMMVLEQKTSLISLICLRCLILFLKWWWNMVIYHGWIRKTSLNHKLSSHVTRSPFKYLSALQALLGSPPFASNWGHLEGVPQPHLRILKGLNNHGLLTTYIHWDDPPSRISEIVKGNLVLKMVIFQLAMLVCFFFGGGRISGPASTSPMPFPYPSEPRF